MKLGLRLAVVAIGLLLAASSGGPALAVSGSFKITLLDGTEIVGTVRSFEDGIYRVETDAGEQQINADAVRGMEPLDAGAAPVSASGVAAAPAVSAPSAEFTILTGDSKLIVGRLKSFSDGVYEIETKIGGVAVPVERVARIEVAWLQTPGAEPSAAPQAAATLLAGSLLVAGSNVMSEAMVPALIEGYVADSGGRDARWSRGTAATLRQLTATTGNAGKFTAELRVRNSAQAVDALIRGEAQIAMMSRQMTVEEAQRVTAAGLGNPFSPVQEHVVAPGGVIVLVHPSNPVKALRLDQIADIFAGRIRNWAEVGGVQRRIQVYLPGEGSGVLDVFRRRALGDRELLATAERVASSVELAEIVSADATAIGLTEFSHLGNAAALSTIDECGFTHTPSAVSLSTEQYPLTTRLYFYTPPKVSQTTRDFLSYVLSGNGQQRLSQRGFVSLLPAIDPQSGVQTPSVQTVAAVDLKIQQQLAELAAAASRLSVVFRFEVAGAALDTRGERDLDRLVAFFQNRTGTRQRIALVGFSDSQGPPDGNVRLSDRRAKLVAQKLKDKGVTADLVVGFGSLLPVACGPSPEASARNRRVEVWLY